MIPAKDRNRVLDRRLAHEHRLEPARQSGVLFNVLAVFVQRCRTDTVQLTARQSRLQEVGGIHGPIRLAGSNQRVHLVDEQDDLARGRLDFGQNTLQAFLELTPIFRAGNQRAHVERKKLLVLERFRHIAIDDAQRKALGNRSLADPWFTNQNRVVLGTARQDLNGPADFLVTADHRVEFTFPGNLGQIPSEFLQRVILVFGSRGIGRPALAKLVDCLVQSVWRNAVPLHQLAGFAVAVHGKGKQKPLHGDETVSSLVGDLLGLLEQACGCLAHVKLSGPTGNFRHLVQKALKIALQCLGVAAGTVDQATGHAFGIIQKNLQDVFRCELLMAPPQGKGLSGLNKTARTLSVFFKVHKLPPTRPHHPKRWGTIWNTDP